KVLGYRAVEGSHFSQSDAQVIGPELFRLAGERDAKAEPVDVLNAAKKKTSPLHRYFEWDDAIAANEHRLGQARYMLRSVEVKIEIVRDSRPCQVWTRGFQNVLPTPEATKKSYVPITVVQQEPFQLSQVIENAERELLGWSQRVQAYKSLTEFRERFGEVIDAIDRLEAEKDEDSNGKAA
ncbi:MAG TPA: hypothetical protein VJS44_14045, partial [Pyrinomonadaceae bacterium]|nr:hypothetical protein [Pyrinomonadaceae bacterium]